MSSEDTNTLTLQGIPDIACPIVVTAEQDSSRNRERNGCYTAQDVVVREGVEFAVSSDIEQAARGVVRAGGESVTVGEESNPSSEHRQLGV